MVEHHSGFRRQRFFVFSAMFIGWSLYTFCQKTFVASMPDLIRHRGLDKTDLGAIASIFTMFYGISKLAVDITASNLSGKLLLSFGLVSSGVCCILFPYSNNILVLTLLWGLHGCVQGFGWPGCANILKSWYASDEIATWWSILTAAGNIAAMTTPLAVANIAFYLGWESAFYLTGAATTIATVFLWLLIKDSPSQPINTSSSSTSMTSRRVKKHSCMEVILNFDVWMLCISYLIFTMLRCCISDWSQLYFVEAADLTESKSGVASFFFFVIAAACVSMYQAGGVVGTILIGYLSDLLIKQNGVGQYKHPRALIVFLNTLLVIGVLHMYSIVVLPGVSKVLLSCLQFCAGSLIEGGTNLVGVAVMDCVVPELSGSSHAMSTFLGQFGGFFAGLPFSYIVKRLGWNYAFLILEFISVVNVLISSFLLLRNNMKNNSNNAIDNEIAKKQR